MITLEQKIAQKEDEIARLKDKANKLDTGQKIIVGGMMLSLAKKDASIAKLLLDNINNEVTRQTDLVRLKAVIAELNAVVYKEDELNQAD